MAGLLISRSKDQLNKTDKQGRTWVPLATSSGHRDMVGLLQGQGAEINIRKRSVLLNLLCTSKEL